MISSIDLNHNILIYFHNILIYFRGFIFCYCSPNLTYPILSNHFYTLTIYICSLYQSLTYILISKLYFAKL